MNFENFSCGHFKIRVVYWVRNKSSLNDDVLLLKRVCVIISCVSDLSYCLLNGYETSEEVDNN